MTDTPKTPDPSPGSKLTISNTTPSGLQKPGTGVKLPGLHARLRNPAAVRPDADPLTRPNRISLMCDASGSMSGPKNKALVDAVTGFVTACDMRDTAVSIDTFGADDDIHVALTTNSGLLLMQAMSIPAQGGTPMAQAMEYVLHTHSLTRAVLVSDGQPDNEASCYEVAQQYREAGVMIDCVHIGDGSHGEACLKRIAEITGGQYIKFTDVTSFSKNFKYLTPAYYGILTSGGVSASDLGAKELK